MGATVAIDLQGAVEDAAAPRGMSTHRFRVRDFGPLTVGSDAHGDSPHRDVQTRANAKLEDLYARL